MKKLLIIGKQLGAEVDLTRLLKRQGYEVINAVGAKDGLELLRVEQPVVAVVDHRDSAFDGVQLLMELRYEDPSCEVIFVTPGGEMEIAIEVLRAGALDYLRYPIDHEELQVALGRAQERRQHAVDDKPSILVLEDHEPTRLRLMSILRKEGYNVDGAGDGEAGLRLVGEKRFDLVLADVKMPIKDGITVLHETKAAGIDVEFIITTGFGNEDQVVEALREGAVNFLRKPIDIDHMVETIKRALDVRNLRHSLALRNRDVELMQELVVRLTGELELVVEAPESIGPTTFGFLQRLVNAVPIGIAVAGPERAVVYANDHLVGRIGEIPTKVTMQWLARIGVTNVTEDELDESYSQILNAAPGSIETLMLSKWAFVIMTPVNVLKRPGVSVRYVVLVVRGERNMKALTADASTE